MAKLIKKIRDANYDFLFIIRVSDLFYQRREL